MAYKRLSFYERCKIQAMMDEQGYQQKEIAEALGRSPSTISREFKRNKTIRWSHVFVVGFIVAIMLKILLIDGKNKNRILLNLLQPLNDLSD